MRLPGCLRQTPCYLLILSHGSRYALSAELMKTSRVQVLFTVLRVPPFPYRPV